MQNQHRITLAKFMWNEFSLNMMAVKKILFLYQSKKIWNCGCLLISRFRRSNPYWWWKSLRTTEWSIFKCIFTWWWFNHWVARSKGIYDRWYYLHSQWYLKNLNSEKASGSDEISARLLKDCANKVADVLVLLFSASIAWRKTAEEWRHAIITPVYKGNSKNWSKADNYRPISLTLVTYKLMEHIIHSHIMKHLDKDRILSQTKHGFRKFCFD